jgi:hypothetical protein
MLLRKTFAALTLLLLAAAAPAGTIAKVNFPDTVTVAGKNLLLNGMGLRQKLFFNLYAGALYLESKSDDDSAILRADAPKRLVLHFLYKEVNREKMVRSFRQGFKENTGAQMGELKPQISRLLDALEPMKKGDELSVTYVPGTGTTLALRGVDKLTIPGLDFAKAFFAIWLGPLPPTDDLKDGLLGKT